VSRLDLPAILVGALVSLGIIVPVALIARLAAGGDDVSSGWNAAFTVLIVGATIVGSGVAARRQTETPMIHGAAAGVLTYVAARLVSIIASGDVPNVIALAFALIVFAAIGAIGGFLVAAFGRTAPNRRS
jgi:putative membrane protein (TIGR04086 family)